MKTRTILATLLFVVLGGVLIWNSALIDRCHFEAGHYAHESVTLPGYHLTYTGVVAGHWESGVWVAPHLGAITVWMPAIPADKQVWLADSCHK